MHAEVVSHRMGRTAGTPADAFYPNPSFNLPFKGQCLSGQEMLDKDLDFYTRHGDLAPTVPLHGEVLSRNDFDN